MVCYLNDYYDYYGMNELRIMDDAINYYDGMVLLIKMPIKRLWIPIMDDCGMKIYENDMNAQIPCHRRDEHPWSLRSYFGCEDSADKPAIWKW